MGISPGATHNLKVVGSNPTPATNFFQLNQHLTRCLFFINPSHDTIKCITQHSHKTHSVFEGNREWKDTAY